MQIKLGDFGLATKLEFEGERKRTVCGTPNYIAPEIIDNTGNSPGHSYEVDVWSLGVIVYTLLIGRPPFETSDVKATYKKIRNCEYSFPDTVQVSEQAKSLIRGILVLDPAKRLKIDEILEHPFFAPTNGQTIPKFMPVSTLACPPSNTMLTQLSSANINNN
jgi:polo-like kinase 1